MALVDFLATHGVFTREEFGAVCGYDPVADRGLLDKRLAYYQKRGRIERIRRGLFASRVGGAWADAYLIATKAAPDAVVAYHSALEYLGRAHSVFFEVTFASVHSVRAFEFGGTRFRPVPFPAGLDSDEKRHSLVTTHGLHKSGVRVTTHERTVVDVLDRPQLAGGWEEVWESITSIEFLDVKAMVEYVKLLGNATTAAKVGWFLESQAEFLKPGEDTLEELEALAPKSPHYLEDRTDGVLLKRWNLVVPKYVLNREWLEPMYSDGDGMVAENTPSGSHGSGGDARV